MAAGTAPLQGVGVLVTRPVHQAGPLCEGIEALGGTAVRFPVLEILAPVDPQALDDGIQRLDDFDWAVFISANAVNGALGRILAVREWPPALKIAVIGKRSAEALKTFGLTADLFPQQHFNSEGLLALPEMQVVSGQRFVIFRGNGGREYLADTLRERGATVDYIEAYRRALPKADNSTLLETWRDGKINIVLVTSGESLQNLVEMVGTPGKSLLIDTPLLVVSERMIQLAEKLGFKHKPVVADNATDEAVLDALLTWRNG
jgi:uroporphyrinogen-III synthase